MIEKEIEFNIDEPLDEHLTKLMVCEKMQAFRCENKLGYTFRKCQENVLGRQHLSIPRPTRRSPSLMGIAPMLARSNHPSGGRVKTSSAKVVPRAYKCRKRKPADSLPDGRAIRITPRYTN